MILKKISSEDLWIEKIISSIIKIADLAISKRGRFDIVLCGGNTPINVYKKLSKIETDWSLWNFWIGDERMLEPNSSELNCKMIEDNFLKFISLKKNANFIDLNLEIEKARELYSKKLQEIKLFDLVLLGIGEDGHTASLFPGNDIGQDENSDLAISVYNSPKFPKQRISMSANRLSLSKNVFYLVNGSNKKSIIKKIMISKNYPVNHIKGKEKTIIYFYEN
jgi:6-phosphogluconolactonase